MKLIFYIRETPLGYHKRIGYEMEGKTQTNCPFGRYERNRWCHTGIRIYYGSKYNHLTITWDGDDMGWCPKGGRCE